MYVACAIPSRMYKTVEEAIASPEGEELYKTLTVSFSRAVLITERVEKRIAEIVFKKLNERESIDLLNRHSETTN